MNFDAETLGMVKNAFNTFREAIGMVRDVKQLLPPKDRATIETSIAKAESETALAEAQIARALGFQLHDCQFPPAIMLAVQTAYGEEKQCRVCGFTTKFHAPMPQAKAAMDYNPLP